MERREFLRAGAVAGAGVASVGGAGCAGLGGLQPPVEIFSTADMKRYLGNLDGAMGAVSTTDAVASLLPRGVANPFSPQDPEWIKGDKLVRKTLRALLLSGSFNGLSEDDRMHPGMQGRMERSLGEMDDAMLGMNDYLAGLTPTEHADLARRMRDDPELVMRIVGALDDEAVKAGVSFARRLQMRSIAVDACARLKQSPGLFIDEYDAKVKKIAARDGTVAEAERRLAVRMGQDAFWAYKDRLATAAHRWDVALAQAGDYDAPPPMYGSPPQPGMKRGTISIIVGASLLGVGAILTGVGIAFIGVDLGFAIMVTVGALLAPGGLITLIVGLVQRAHARAVTMGETPIPPARPVTRAGSPSRGWARSRRSEATPRRSGPRWPPGETGSGQSRASPPRATPRTPAGWWPITTTGILRSRTARCAWASPCPPPARRSPRPGPKAPALRTASPSSWDRA